VIDARDEEMGAWFEARIVNISPANNNGTISDNNGSISEQQPDTAGVAVSTDLQESVTADSSYTDVTADNTLSDDDDGFLYSIVYERSVTFVVLFSVPLWYTMLTGSSCILYRIQEKYVLFLIITFVHVDQFSKFFRGQILQEGLWIVCAVLVWNMASVVLLRCWVGN